jgi:DNA modification methylase
VVWVVNDETVKGSRTGTSARQQLYFQDLGFWLHDHMIYRKGSPAYPSQNRYYSVWENMFVFSKGKPATVNLLRDRKNLWNGEKWGKERIRRNAAGELTRSEWSPSQGGEFGVRFNVWKYLAGHTHSTDDAIAFKHPAIFPEKLAHDHIVSWSNRGDVVLDPMVGSGTVPKMCKMTGRQYIGIDISEEYCEIAKVRLGESVEDWDPGDPDDSGDERQPRLL